MAARKDKSEEDLILEDKLDAARTLVRLRGRKLQRRELNELEPALVDQHAKEVQAGAVTELNIDPGALIQQALPPAPEDA